jgi:hypothetical protein
MAAEWQTAMEALILVAEKNGSTMMARIGVIRFSLICSCTAATNGAPPFSL